MGDLNLCKIHEKVSKGKEREFVIDGSGGLRFEGRLCVPEVDTLRRDIMEEAHKSTYSVHPSATKMYQDLKLVY